MKWAGRIVAAAALAGGWAAAAAARGLPGVPAPVQSQEEIARNEKALAELRAGRDVAKNTAILRAAVERAADPAAIALQIGGVLVAEERWGPAVGFLDIARERRPEDGNVAQLLGRVHARLLRFDDAVRHLEAADRLLPPGPRPYLKRFLATSLSGLQRFEEAERRALEAIAEAEALNGALAPGKAPLPLAEFELALAEVHHVAVRFDQALAVLDRLAQRPLAPAERTKAALLRAKILDSRGDEAGALAAFAVAREASPKDAGPCYEHAAFLLRRQRHADARPLLEQAVALDPDHEGAWFNLARVLPRTGDPEAGKAAQARYRTIHDSKIAEDERLTALRRALTAR